MTFIFTPDVHLKSIHDITPQWLKQQDIRAIVLDLDGTLAATHALDPDELTVSWTQGMKNAGFGIAVLSNNNAVRVSRFCRSLDVPYIANAMKPLLVGFKRVSHLLGEEPRHIAFVGDQIYTDVLGANLFGMLSIAVDRAGKKAGGIAALKHLLEGPVWRRYKRLRAKGKRP